MKDKGTADWGKEMRWIRPEGRIHLWNYCRYYLGVSVPRGVVTEGHRSPMDYLWYAFNADFVKKQASNADAVVWACRGGGKTELCGLLTLLECVFKPGVQIRILSGSGSQAGRLYDYFRGFVSRGYDKQVAEISTWPTDKTLFKNGAMVEVLKQSETSVRSHHVHKLRCDEVELFKPKVHEAAQFTTMSTGGWVASIDSVSTMHKMGGLMSRIVKEANRIGTPVFRWNIWDVMEKCVGRNCRECKLGEICDGQPRRKKAGDGYYKFGDVVTAMQRTKPRRFLVEMLCGEYGKKKGEYGGGVRLY